MSMRTSLINWLKSFAAVYRPHMPTDYHTHRTTAGQPKKFPLLAAPKPSERGLRRDQRAVCFAPRAARRPCPPLDDARSTSQIRALVTSGIRNVPHERRASVCGSAAGVALRLRFASRLSASAPLSPLADRRPKPRQTAQMR